MKLNQNQLKAVEHQSGPLLVVAGAGTGKTTVLTERIKFLTSQQNVDPNQIFATTFTTRAAEEIIVRLDKTMPMGYEEPWLGTFHSLCDRLLRAEGLEIGIDPNFKILTPTDQWIFLREHLFKLNLEYYSPLGSPAKFLSAIIQFFSRIADEDTSISEFESVKLNRLNSAATEEEKVESARISELYSAYQIYQQLKHDSAVYDFSDLISLTLHLFRTRPNILKKYQTKFSHLIIDEFQDTNIAQFELIKLLAPPQSNPNLVVVGDDDQSIYKFRGASISNILQFKSIYQNASQVVLTDNYRSSQSILDASYDVIQNNNPDRLEPKLKITKKLISHQEESSEVQIHHFDHIDQETEWVVKQINQLITKQNISPQNIAVLARANTHLQPISSALKRQLIPHQLVSNYGLFDQPEVDQLINILLTLHNPHHSQNLYQFLSLPFLNISSENIYFELNNAVKNSSTLYQYLCDSQNGLFTPAIELIKQYRSLAANKSITLLLFKFINSNKLLEPYLKTESLENQLKINNINLFFQKLKKFEEVVDNPNLPTFIETYSSWIEAGESPGQAQIEDIDTVTLSTIHSAKGLEYKVVFIPNLIAGRFPSRNIKDRIQVPEELIKEQLPEGNEHIAEERRLFYVGITRAKTHLYLTAAKNVGGATTRKLSGFVGEANLPIVETAFVAQSSVMDDTDLDNNDYLSNKPISNNLTHISYSQIDTFDACPLKYKYRYILKIPAEPNHTLSFGRTIHQTLHLFHAQEIAGQKPTQKQLLNLYQENFISEGYDSSEHKEARYKSGKAALKRYYKLHKRLLGTPIMLEQSFRLRVDDKTTLIGKIDRIDLHNSKHVIVDYKTGQPKDQKKVDKDDQLTLYALAANEALGHSIQNMSLFFIEAKDKQLITTTRDDKSLNKAKNKLSEKVTKIRNSKFKPTPGFVCGYCEYNQFCPFAKS